MKKKTAAKLSGAKQSAGIARKKATGKPFEKGNPYAFKPGQSGNPGGRPKSKFISDAYRQWLSQPSESDPSLTNADIIAASIGKLAIAGNINAVREIADRVEGAARQTIDLNESERKTWLYERMIERVARRVFDERGETISREQVIEQVAIYLPEIKEYVN
jgi:hypothetical protein